MFHEGSGRVQDFDAVLQSVRAAACSLTGASYGLLTLLDDAGPTDDSELNKMGTPADLSGMFPA